MIFSVQYQKFREIGIKIPGQLIFLHYISFREEKKEIERRKLIHDRNVKMKQQLQPNHDGQNQSELL